MTDEERREWKRRGGEREQEKLIEKMRDRKFFESQEYLNTVCRPKGLHEEKKAKLERRLERLKQRRQERQH